MLGILGGDARCPIARALDVVGEKWTLMVVRDALAGATRFSEFQTSLGLPRDVLAGRLDTLVEAGVMARHPYKPDTGRTRDEYVLTPAGHELSLVLLALGDWADRNRPNPGTPNLEFVDPAGERVRPAAVAGDRVLRTEDVTVRRQA
ncbi:HxlR family transcriptional regulator [Luteimicrobium album]|uniref:HxlR family transcriptional regulator n=1 Tax=Luteimicrobium album TaxID=1054550 RepID=A0ABQ6HY81_9MICO|nr:helix-turn-helix domain-containing protein [Luteimicrobium album]GMA23458.1 HxlR family transcriptional regulator [Luteimicrobium album]